MEWLELKLWCNFMNRVREKVKNWRKEDRPEKKLQTQKPTCDLDGWPTCKPVPSRVPRSRHVARRRATTIVARSIPRSTRPASDPGPPPRTSDFLPRAANFARPTAQACAPGFHPEPIWSTSARLGFEPVDSHPRLMVWLGGFGPVQAQMLGSWTGSRSFWAGSVYFFLKVFKPVGVFREL